MTQPRESAPREWPEKHDGAFANRANVRLWLRLLSCATVVEKRLRRRLAERGTTLPRFDVMAALDRSPHGLPMGELSNALLVSNGNVTGLVQGLVRDGLAHIAPSAADKRVWIAGLTPAGRESFAALSLFHHDWVDAMFAGLGGADREQLGRLLGLLKASIAQEAVTPVQGGEIAA